MEYKKQHVNQKLRNEMNPTYNQDNSKNPTKINICSILFRNYKQLNYQMQNSRGKYTHSNDKSNNPTNINILSKLEKTTNDFPTKCKTRKQNKHVFQR